MLTDSDRERLLLWGLFHRGVAVMMALATAQLVGQFGVFSGRRGIVPVALRMERLRLDWPGSGWTRFAKMPSVLWLTHSDLAQRAWLVASTVVALGVALGAVPAGWVWLAMLFCWAVYVSFMHACELAFPWDMLLAEASFLSVFLPSTLPWMELSAAQLPLPMVAFAFRLLLFRLMFGFGKTKFSGSTRHDRMYIYGMMINQPLPSPIGWIMFQLAPRTFYIVGMGVLFLTEIVMPFFAVFPGPGPFSVATAIGTSALMIGIQLSGNFGFFNMLTCLLCVPLLDTHYGVLPWTWTGTPTALVGAPDAVLGFWVTTLVLTILLAAVPLCLLFNSWTAESMYFWPTLQVIPLLKFYRQLYPFHVVHSYGVFPPHSFPGVRFIVVYEGSADGERWERYEYKFTTSAAHTRPVIAAPYHPRFDMIMFYAANGFRRDSLHHPLLAGNAYTFGRSYFSRVVAQRLLEGGSPVADEFGHNPFPDPKRPPKFVRARVHLFEPTSMSEMTKHGKWWNDTVLHEHLAPVSLHSSPSAWFWRNQFSDPSQWHFDMTLWRHRSPAMRQLLHRPTGTGGDEIDDAGDAAERIAEWLCEQDDAPDTLFPRPPIDDEFLGDAERKADQPCMLPITRSAVVDFWTRVLPSLSEVPEDNQSWWSRALAMAAKLRDEYSVEEQQRVYRIAMLLTSTLLHRFEQLATIKVQDVREDSPAPKIDVTNARLVLPCRSYFHVGLACQHIMLYGGAVSSWRTMCMLDTTAEWHESPPSRAMRQHTIDVLTLLRSLSVDKDDNAELERSCVLFAVLRPDLFILHGRKTRMQARMHNGAIPPQLPLPGFLWLTKMLLKSFVPSPAAEHAQARVDVDKTYAFAGHVLPLPDEVLPKFRFTPDCVWRLQGFDRDLTLVEAFQFTKDIVSDGKTN
eukprot:TRINITY_DN65950_c6_g1_i1.p1 TRINITY_DN65950_c6_g1~~TRINITY_DN65950_c6_g1_i1.p1  ORF type:complete len:915 (-),score=378.68 TRINITY_DN65950_c6_g1_i1:106-2826(-)